MCNGHNADPNFSRNGANDIILETSISLFMCNTFAAALYSIEIQRYYALYSTSWKFMNTPLVGFAMKVLNQARQRFFDYRAKETYKPLFFRTEHSGCWK